jgi:hypothetical protein
MKSRSDLSQLATMSHDEAEYFLTERRPTALEDRTESDPVGLLRDAHMEFT